MIGALNSLRILASQALGAAGMALDPFEPRVAELAADALAAAEAEIEVAEPRSRREFLGPYTAGFHDDGPSCGDDFTYADFYWAAFILRAFADGKLTGPGLICIQPDFYTELADKFRAAADKVNEESVGPSSEVTYLDEIAGHLAAQTPLLEDIRNLLNASAAPGLLPHQPPAAAAEREPAPGRTDSLLPGAGHLTATPQCLRVAARGLRQWLDGDVCTATSYWRSIAASLDAVAGAREAINDITQ